MHFDSRHPDYRAVWDGYPIAKFKAARGSGKKRGDENKKTRRIPEENRVENVLDNRWRGGVLSACGTHNTWQKAGSPEGNVGMKTQEIPKKTA